MQLLIMAAGMGSRFGGLKQIAPMGPNDEFIIDYSIYDAIKEGFSKVVFIIKEENYDIFKETIGSRVEPHVPVEYVFQKLENIPDFVKIPEERIKPWGTAHAIYCAKEAITEPFLVINADDFYGNDAFKVAADFLKNSKEKEYATIGYEAIKTMTENGSVKRGVIFSNENKLDSIVESSIIEDGNKIACTPLNGAEPFKIEKIGEHKFRISGEKVERILKMTKFQTEESVLRFENKLRHLGIDEALIKMGCEEGDTIYILDYEFDFKI